MCGLIGCISKSTAGFISAERDIMEQMIYADAVRGWDSTGMFGVNNHGNIDVLKQAVAASVFLCHPETNKFLNKMVSDYQIIIGHNRKATHGEKVSDNAHPFWSDNEKVVLVHNGMVHNHRDFDNKVVDSHSVCNAFGNAENIDAVKDIIKRISGAFAFIWYNVPEKKLYFCHNDQRPLFLLETAIALYMASEEEMAEWVINRNNQTITQVVSVAKDTLFSISLGTNKIVNEGEVAKAPTFFQKQEPEAQKGVGSTTSNIIQLPAILHKNGGQINGSGTTNKDFTVLQSDLLANDNIFLQDEDILDAVHASQKYKEGEFILWQAHDYFEWQHNVTQEKMYTIVGKPVNQINDHIKILVHVNEDVFKTCNLTQILKSEIINISVSHKNVCNIRVVSFLEDTPICTMNDFLLTHDMFNNYWFSNTCQCCNEIVHYNQLKDCVVKVEDCLASVLCPKCSKEQHGSDYFDSL